MNDLAGRPRQGRGFLFDLSLQDASEPYYLSSSKIS
jgi:hypothetical protein